VGAGWHGIVEEVRMRWIVGAVAIGLALLVAGCETPERRDGLGAPPTPILSTRPLPIVRAIPRPKPEPPSPPPKPKALPGASVSAADVRVTGGINRGKWRVIVVHHSASATATPDGMHKYHRDVRHWSNGLGYHFVIGNGVNYPDGRLYVGNRWRQQITGAHCKSRSGTYFGDWRPDNYFNEHGIGICLIGNLEKSRPTARQLQTLQSLIAVLVREAGVNAGRIYGHGEVTHKTLCPGRYLDMDQVRARVAALVVAPPPTQIERAGAADRPPVVAAVVGPATFARHARRRRYVHRRN
jgi:N-acetylmuramoyl-L-alanine amidase